MKKKKGDWSYKYNRANLVIWNLFIYLLYFLKIFYLFFRKRGRKGEREGEKDQRVVASPMPPAGDLARNPDMCLDWA